MHASTRNFLIGVLLAWMGGVCAQPLEIITLKHRPAEQLVPQLMPMLEPGAALTGTGDKLFVRTSSRNLADIRRMLDELDRAPRRLMIAVRQGSQRRDGGSAVDVAGAVVLGNNVRIISSGRGDATAGTMEIRRGETAIRGNAYEASTADDVSQRVQTVEGGRAWINVGRSVPLPLRQVVMTPTGAHVSETVVYRDVGTGFYAEAKLAGDRVTLDISPTHDTPGAQPGSAHIQRLSTTVSGRLGEWMELGGSAQEVSGDRAGGLGYSTRRAGEDGRVWLKVDVLP